MQESLFDRNTHLFSRRFPQLYAMHRHIFTVPPPLPETWAALTAKTGAPTVRESGTLLHSAYDPQKEAEQMIRGMADSKTAGVFCGFGLGYAAAAFARAYPQKRLILIEPDACRLVSAMTLNDWNDVLEQADCIFLIGAGQDTVLQILEQSGIENCAFFSVPAQTRHAQQYFDTLGELIRRNRQKQNINKRTLERFSRLWLRNSCLNMPLLAELGGINRYAGKAAHLKACVLAAGPSLQRALPLLPLIKEKMLLICVDTALRACLKRGVEPDFIITADPQYWNARHLEGLSSPSSILITEIAACPAVFRFPCRQILLFSSLYPPGKFMEKYCGPFGELGAGGSVAACAWEFARYIGCTEIFTAGLDLGFPGGQTHVRGSTFEEMIHANSCRTDTADNATARTLFSAETIYGCDFRGNRIQTDNRMRMYAWWFESRLAQFRRHRTYTLTPDSLKIPGISVFPAADIAAFPSAEKDRQNFINQAEITPTEFEQMEERCRTALKKLNEGLSALLRAAQDAAAYCGQQLSLPETDFAAVSRILTQYDRAISSSETAETAALVFPSRTLLEKEFGHMPHEYDEKKLHIRKSLIIYRHIGSAVREYQKILSKAGSMPRQIGPI